MPKVHNRHEFNERRRQLRNEPSEPERLLWASIKTRQLNGVKFRRQFGIGPYIVDFYCPQHHLVIEVDGDSHFTPEGQEYDHERTAYLVGLGLSVIRFTNHDVRTNIDGVIERISSHVLPPPYQGGV